MRRTIICTALGLLGLALAMPGAASADTWTVTTSADGGPGSLRQLIAAAADGDTILVGARDIVLTAGELSMPGAKPLTIVGAGARATSISGNHATRIFDTTAPLTLRGMTLRDGQVSGDGGAIWTNSPLTLTDMAFVGNTSTSSEGGAVHAATDSVTINRSLFANNSAQGDGGALQFAGNTLVTVQNSTFVGNSSAAQAGALAVNYVDPATTVALVNDTFVGNRAAPGAPGSVFRVGSEQTVSYRSSLFVDNGGACAQGGLAHAVSNGHNVFDGTPSSDCNLIASDATVADAHVSALGNHGGPTDTVLPLANSAAIDAAATPYCPGTDARGIVRPFGAGCDVGAVELAPPAVTTGSAGSVTGSSAVLSGSVDGHGLGPVTSRFEWGPTASYGHFTGVTSSATTAAAVSETLGGLPAGTTIHYRLIATTYDGTATGGDRTFTTTAPGSSSPPPVSTPAATTCKVPRLRGLKLARAKHKLVAAGCKVGHVRRVWSRRIKRRHVVGTRPRAGTELPATTSVRLRVSRGRRNA